MEEKQPSLLHLLLLLPSLYFTLPALLQSDAAKSKSSQRHVCLPSRGAPSGCGCVSLCIQINNPPGQRSMPRIKRSVTSFGCCWTTAVRVGLFFVFFIVWHVEELWPLSQCLYRQLPPFLQWRAAGAQGVHVELFCHQAATGTVFGPVATKPGGPGPQTGVSLWECRLFPRVMSDTL